MILQQILSFGKFFRKSNINGWEPLRTALVAHDFNNREIKSFYDSFSKRLSKNHSIDDVRRFIRNEIIRSSGEMCHSIAPIRQRRPWVVMVAGINGAGKSSAVARLAKFWQDQSYKVMMVGADCFRSGAFEQLAEISTKNKIPLHNSGGMGKNSSSVVYQALQEAKRKYDVLLIDTAGRLSNNRDLMFELRKMKKSLQKVDQFAPDEVLLVLDNTIGGNNYHQVRKFQAEVGITGLILTKMDYSSTASIYKMCRACKVGISFITTGEGISNLAEFNPAVNMNLANQLAGQLVGSTHEGDIS